MEAVVGRFGAEAVRVVVLGMQLAPTSLEGLDEEILHKMNMMRSYLGKGARNGATVVG